MSDNGKRNIANYLVGRRSMVQWMAADTISATVNGVETIPDLSGNGRNASVSSAYFPQLVDEQINTCPVIRFNSSTNPVKYTGSVQVANIFIVAKYNGTSFTGTNGLITPLSSGINSGLVGKAAASASFLNFSLDEVFSKSNRICPSFRMDAPMGEFCVIELQYPAAQTWDGIQIGQNRADTSNRWYGDVAEWMVFSEILTDMERAKIYEFFARKYHLWEVDSKSGDFIFPFRSDWNPKMPARKNVLMDLAEDFTPNYITKRDKKRHFEVDFSKRCYDEVDAAEVFWDFHYPGKTFVFRDKTRIPYRYFSVRFAMDSEISDEPSGYIRNQYQLLMDEAVTSYTDLSDSLSVFEGGLSVYDDSTGLTLLINL